VIRALLQHHLERARRGEIKNALRNCHVYGLQSVVLHDAPGNRIRLFCAADDHHMAWEERGKQPMPLAIHQHHCDVTLVGVFGSAASLEFQLGGDGGYDLTKCRFDSAITGAGALVSRGVKRHLWITHRVTLNHGVSAAMRADVLHTVTVPDGQSAAWLVLEGAEDPDYLSVCYTNNPTWDPSHLYRKPEREEVAAWLFKALEGCP
jgi:hypothetical protein